MYRQILIQPIAEHDGGVRISFYEVAIWNLQFPSIPLILFPALENVCTCDDSPSVLCAAIYNRFLLCTSVYRAYIFSINTASYQDFISCHGYICGILNMHERMVFTTIAVYFDLAINIPNHDISSK